ncbi:MAG: FAD-dependent monooxygenase, partial [Woeseia sp.]
GFRIDAGALHIWPRGGFMLIALPNPGGDFTLTLFMPKNGDVSFEALQSASDITAFFEKHFADILPQLPQLQTEFANNPVGILGTVRCQRWSDRELLLIGDAAHAIVPFHGQGMNLAFEDCALLDAHVQNSNGSWSDAFAAFAAEQQPNAEAIADMALDNYVEMRDRVRDPKFVLHKQLAFEFERRMPGRFIPRYSMVMFHPEIPYAVAQQRGAMQQRLLQEIAAGVNSVEEVDLEAAEEKVRGALPALDELSVNQ